MVLGLQVRLLPWKHQNLVRRLASLSLVHTLAVVAVLVTLFEMHTHTHLPTHTHTHTHTHTQLPLNPPHSCTPQTYNQPVHSYTGLTLKSHQLADSSASRSGSTTKTVTTQRETVSFLMKRCTSYRHLHRLAVSLTSPIYSCTCPLGLGTMCTCRLKLLQERGRKPG